MKPNDSAAKANDALKNALEAICLVPATANDAGDVKNFSLIQKSNHVFSTRGLALEDNVRIGSDVRQVVIRRTSRATGRKLWLGYSMPESGLFKGLRRDLLALFVHPKHWFSNFEDENLQTISLCLLACGVLRRFEVGGERNRSKLLGARVFCGNNISDHRPNLSSMMRHDDCPSMPLRIRLVPTATLS